MDYAIGNEDWYNSIDAQREAGENYVAAQRGAGWVLVATRYDDPDFSGGNFERPAFKQMMRDIEEGFIDSIVVYKMDRLSRSLVDFLTFEKGLHAKGVNIVSVTEQFATDSAQGRLYLNMTMSFAQHEREIAGERIRNKIAASKKKGLWMGGPPQLGYDCVDRKLRVNKEEAKQVRWIFNNFIKIGSVTKLIREMRDKGMCTKSYISRRGVPHQGRLFGKTPLYRLLRSKVVIGKIVHKDNVYEGEHEAIVPLDTWDMVQDILDDTPDRSVNTGRPPKAVPLLKGKLFCECCDSAMTHNHTKKKNKLYCYYTPNAYLKGLCTNCKVKSIPAGVMDKMVLDQIEKIIQSPAILLKVWKQANNENSEITEQEVIKAFENLAPIWRELFPTEQRELIDLLIKRIEMSSQGAFIHLRLTGLESVAKHLQKGSKNEH